MSNEVKQRVLDQLHAGVATVVFTKADGTRREMNCTLSEAMLPPKQEDNSKQARKENPDVQSVWDVDKQGWRSFRWDRLVEGEN